jgi:5-methyltetrahydropteroyltriglutamate--homocysteine methyltransferase
MKLPAGKTLVLGVVEHATDLAKPPARVIETLQNCAKLIDMENLQAGTDSGIGSRVGHEDVVRARLKAMADGAALATKRSKRR